MLTVRRREWAISNAHAESGPRQDARDERAAQLAYMSRVHEREDGRLCVLAGDFNARDGEDHCLRAEGWRDVWATTPAGGHAWDAAAWTWRRSESAARYDRVYVHGGDDTVTVVSLALLRQVWGALTDHAALRVVLHMEPKAVAVLPLTGGAWPPQQLLRRHARVST